MVKVKDIKTRKANSRARITVKSLIIGVKKRLNKEKVEAVMALLEQKYREIAEARKIVKKLEKQIKDIENKDIEEIDTDDYEYNEDEDED